ncbi:MAG: hypothetical protein KIH08_13450 [Candidatus Freyarchaeota archaeon]|nr:hypothetical protein [Candidatus Jordarchaeia archaeon]MBS7270042.1 hypothetical protein [Candidatus Jordarchaeia archaeon]MBS7280492.1 hypothetical protein [Candidatus Jordarchaeia archaeon]
MRVNKIGKPVKGGVLLLMVGLTLILLSAALNNYLAFEIRPVSGEQAWAKGEWVLVPPKGYFIKVIAADAGDTVGGSYQASERLHVFLFDDENFIKFVCGAPNYAPLSSTLWSTAACYYGATLKNGHFIIVIHNPTDRIALLYSCCHFYDTESMPFPKTESFIPPILLVLGASFSIFGSALLVWKKFHQKSRFF